MRNYAKASPERDYVLCFPHLLQGFPLLLFICKYLKTVHLHEETSQKQFQKQLNYLINSLSETCQVPVSVTGAGRTLWCPVGEQKGQVVACHKQCLSSQRILQPQVGHNTESSGCSNAEEVHYVVTGVKVPRPPEAHRHIAT